MQRRNLLLAATAVALASTACKETVLEVVEVATVEVSGLSGPVLIGVEAQLTARALDDRGNELSRRTITWSTSNAAIASVDANGRVRGVGVGSATISAAAEGVNGSASVNVQYGVPTISATNPANVLMQSGAFTLTVTGTNFAPASVIRWNGANRTTTFVNATTLTAAIPASDVTTPSFVDINVFTPAPGGGTSAARQFPVRLNVSGPLIATGFDHTCALSGVSAYCWGVNGAGQLGDGTSTDRLTPSAISGISLLAISSYNATTCGLDLIGLAYCWGSTQSGMRGQGTGSAGLAPNAVADAKQYRAISVGSTHTCALELSGSAWCWGSSFSGEIGNGTTQSQNRPTAVSGGLTFTSIAAGSLFTCAVTTAGAAYCWGENSFGQLGDGTTTDRLLPVPVQSALVFTSIYAGDLSACARTAAGAVYCWGAGFSGQLGHGSTSPSSTPVQTILPPVATVDAGSSNSCSVTSAGAVYCWGDNDWAQLGIGNTIDRTTPAQITGLPAVRDISSATRHTCALTTTNEVYCWGSKGRGALGDGTTAIRSTPAPVTGGATPFSSVLVGNELSCGLRSTGGRVSCWGSGRLGQIGNGATADAVLPTDVSATAQYTLIATGYNHACAIVSGTRAVQCWGSGTSGQLGTTSGLDSPVPVSAAGTQQYQHIAAGLSHTCGVTITGSLFCWGSNGFGQLGNGSTIFSATPTPVSAPAGIGFNSVSAGNNHSCAVSTTGTVYCWGVNSNGTLGDGTTTQRFTPVLVTGLTGIAEVSAGSSHTCARNSTGSAWCWGFNGVGELGTGQSGSASSSSTPVPVTGSLSFRAISAGRQATCAVTNTNQGYCWGINFVGQGGTGTLGSANTPQAVSGGLAWSSIDIYGDHTCGVTTAGVAYCWGFMRIGELGNGQTGLEPLPKRVQGGVFSIVAGRFKR